MHRRRVRGQRHPDVAPELAAGHYTDLTLCGEHDSDWYAESLAASTCYTFDVLFSAANGNIDATLFARDLHAVATGTATGDNERITYCTGSAESGTFLLHVFLPTDGVYRQTYVLTWLREARRPPHRVIGLLLAAVKDEG